MALDWLPTYPDTIRRRVLLTASYQQHYAGAAFPVVSPAGWLPSYPDRVPRKTLPAALRPSYFPPADDRPALPSPELAWKASYPDQIARRVLPTADHPSVFSVPFRTFTQVENWAFFPDRVDRVTMRPSSQVFEALKLEGIPPFLSWQPSYPEHVQAKVSLFAAGQQSFAFAPSPVAAPDPPGLGYLTTSFPAGVRPLASSLHVSAQPFFTMNVDPLPNAGPPTDYTWQGGYPDLLPVQRARPAFSVLVQPLSHLADLGWLPELPDEMTRRGGRVTPHSLASPLQTSSTFDLPGSALWYPSFPSSTRRVVSVYDYLGPVPITVSSLLPPALDCIAWTAEGLDRPHIVGEDLTRSQIVNEDATGPAVKVEKSC